MSETCERFNYGYTPTGSFLGEAQVASYFDPETGKLVAQKLRYPDKSFRILGRMQQAGLFGQSLYGTNGGSRITITEGEIDTLSISAAFGPLEAVVSLRNGASGAKKDIQQHLSFLEGYKEIVLAFDTDEPGRKAIEDVVALLPPGRVKLYNYPADCKDANDVLIKHGPIAVQNGVYNSVAWAPDELVNASMLWDEINKPVIRGLSWPWQTLTDLTYGVRPGETYVFGAGTGVGKTTFFKEIETHMLVAHKQTIGIIHIEEAINATMIGIMSKHARKNFGVPGAKFTEQEKHDAFEETAGTNRLHIYRSDSSLDFDTIFSRIRYMVLGLGCKHIFLDHITALADGIEEENKINQFMRKIISSLVIWFTRNDATLYMISHLRKAQGKPHEEGGRVHLDDLYGAAALKQWAYFVFGLERNQQCEDPEERQITTLRVLKDRYTGQAIGETISVKYDGQTGGLEEITNESKNEVQPSTESCPF